MTRPARCWPGRVGTSPAASPASASTPALPDLPTYRPDGPIPIQTRDVHLFREIDGRIGRYAVGHYGHAGWLEVSVLHYDNRADPLRIAGRQYAWRTRFNHASLRLRLPGNWEVLAQGLRGETLMGPTAVQVDFAAWYVLATHALGEALDLAAL